MIRKNRGQVYLAKNRHGMRSDLQIDREKGAKIVLKRPIDTNFNEYEAF